MARSTNRVAIPAAATRALFMGAIAAVSGVTGTRDAAAQTCGPQWFPTFGGVSGGASPVVNALTVWDPDASGPQPPMVVVGGTFTTAGGITVNNIARWSGSSWYPLGSGVGGTVSALATLPNGDLIAGGAFLTAGGAPANRIARWDGAAWHPLGSGTDSTVQVLAALPNGDLIAGGTFVTAGGVTVNRIARWDGANWFAFGTGLDNFVSALTTLTNGDVIAGGAFLNAGGSPASHIARWNGAAWSALGSGTSGVVRALTTTTGGDLIAGGTYATAGGITVNNIARWNGTAWFALGSGTSAGVNALITLPSGDIVAGGGFFSAGGTTVNLVARWDGASWSALGSGVGATVLALTALPSGDVVAGGVFSTASGQTAERVARHSFTGLPSVTVPPEPVTVSQGQTVSLSASISRGLSGFAAQWQRDGVNISNGPGGASPGGGTVAGAAELLSSPVDGAPATLTITSAQPSDTGQYAVVFTNVCGSVTSVAATVTVAGAGCPSDLNGDGLINTADLAIFLGDFGEACR